jgi:hypothetical protein
MTNPMGVFPTGTPNQAVTGTLAVLNDAVTIATDSLGSIGVNLTGTNAGATVVFEGTINGTVWDTLKVYPLTVGAAGVTSATAAGDFEFNGAAFTQVRVRLSVAGSGSFTASLNGTVAAKHIGVKNGNAADFQATVIPSVGGSAVSAGNPLPVSIISGGGGGGNAAAGATGAVVPVDADYMGFNSGGNLVGVSSANPFPVTQSIGGSPISTANPVPVTTPISGPLTGQVAIATTGTALALGSATLANGVIVKAASTNAATILVGPSGVTNTNNGTGNGYPLAPGEAISFAAANLNQVFINGTAADFVSFAGN